MRRFASKTWRKCAVGGGWLRAGLALLAVVAVAAGNVARAQFSFSSPQDLGNAVWGSVTNDNTFATPDVGAPNIAGNPPTGPLWYTWTAPQDGDVELDTVGSVDDLTGTSRLDTVLGVFQGTSLGNLNQLAANDDLYPINSSLSVAVATPVPELGTTYGVVPLFYGPSHLHFTAKGGQVYYFAADTKAATFPGFGNITLQWAYKSSGVFRWATEDSDVFTRQPLYQTSQIESSLPAGSGNVDVDSVVLTYYTYNAQGCLVTVTRSAGSKGRVSVDYTTEDGSLLPSLPPQCLPATSVPYTNITVYVVVNYTPPLDMNAYDPSMNVTNDHFVSYDVFTTITNVLPGDYTPVSGTLVFDDFEMSKTILVPINPLGGSLSNPGISTNVIDLNTFQVAQLSSSANNVYNTVFGISLSNPQRDTNENVNVSAPRVDPTLGTAEIKIRNTGADPYGPDFVKSVTTNDVQLIVNTNQVITGTNYLTVTNVVLALAPTNNLFNFEKAAYRVPGDVTDPSGSPYTWADIVLYVERTGTNTSAETINYQVDAILPSDAAHEGNNEFPLQPASDYAVPLPANQNTTIRNYPLGVYDRVSTNYDFDVADGTLSFPANGAGEFYQPIHIRIPVSKATKFNKDFNVTLYRVVKNVALLVGMSAQTTVTVMFNDENPPAGSVDEFYNADFSSDMATLPSKRPITTPVDNSNPGVGSPGFPGQVYGITFWTNGEAFIGGAFPTYNGNDRAGVALVQTNGQLDTAFDPGSGVSGDISHQGNSSAVNAVASWFSQFYIGGNFSSYNGTLVGGIARLNPDGTIDPAFSPGLGANGIVRALAVQPNGQVLVGGEFTQINGVTHNYLARLNPDGSVDSTFNVSNIINGPVYSIALPPAPIAFSNSSPPAAQGNTSQTVRLGPESSGFLAINFGGGTNQWQVYYGSPQLGNLIYNQINGGGTFLTFFGPSAGFATNVLTIVVNQTYATPTNWSYNGVVSFPGLTNGIMVGGNFSETVNGQTYYNIARLETNGSLDTTFSPGTGTGGKVRSLSWQPDNKILAGGEFSTVNGLSYNHLVRFNPDGSLDNTNFFFGTGADGVVYSVDGEFDGIYIGGSFETVNGTLRRGFARLYYNGTLDTTFMDTAYNQFAGLKKIYDFSALPTILNSAAVFASAEQADHNLLIGGSFFQVGGGQASTNVANSLDDELFIGESFDDTNLWVEPKTRDGFRNRTGLARVIGGSTPGPGNISLSAGTYTQDKSQSTLTVGMVRTNGTLGPVWANFYVQNGTALAGQDFKYQSPPPLFWIGWLYLSHPTRMKEDGLYGTSGNLLDPLGLFLPLADGEFNNLSKATVSIIKNNLNPGNLNSQFQLVNPSLDSFFLGGQEIPMGTGLGVSSATFTLIDDTSYPGQFGFKSLSYFATNLSPAISVVRSNGTFGVVSMSYSTANGTALAGTDYVGLTNKPLSFANNSVSNGFNVTILNDGSVAPVEKYFNVNLFNLGGTPGATFGFSNAIVRIINPSFRGFVTLGATNYTGNLSSGVVNFTVNRVAGSLGSVSVDYATTNGPTAFSGVDFVGVTNRLSWVSGDVSPRTVSVPLLPNQGVGSSKQFGVRLYAPMLNTATNYALMGIISNATLTISNDNSYGALQFSSSFYNVNEGTNNYATITVIRTGGTVGTVSANFSTGGGLNTTAGVNYAPTNGTLVFASGQIAESFRVYVYDDGVTDPPPASFYFNVALSNPTNAVVGTPGVTQVRLLDAESFNRPPGSDDTGFTSTGMNGDVLSLSLNSSAQIVAGGNFTAVGTTGRGSVARLNPDGSLDTTFLAGLSGANAAVNSVMCQTDDRVLVGGAFTTMDGVNRGFIARLMTDGSLDTSFNPGSGADSVVNAVAETFAFSGTNLARQVYLGGAFGSVNGNSSPGVERLNNDGSVDLGFSAGSGANGPVYAIAVYPTNSIYWGKVLVGGSFNGFNGTTVSNLVRLNSDGSLDTAFNAALGAGAGAAVHALAVQLDDKVLVGGSFTNFNGAAANNLVRLNTDGSLDTNFLAAASGANGTVEAIALSADTRIMVSGQFTTFNGNTRNHITRLQPTGATDPTINFGYGANGDVEALAIQPLDDAIVLGGAFSQFNGVPHARIARIYGGAVSDSGAFQFTAADYQVHERGIMATITVIRTGGTSGTNSDGTGSVSVGMFTSDGSAFNGTNYLAVSTNLTFPSGEVLQTVQIPVLDDMVITTNLVAYLTLTNPTAPAVLGNQPVATLTIINDDNAIAFSSANYSQVKNVPTGVANIDILRLGGTNSSATLTFFTTTNGTAVTNVDYYATNTTVVFNPGDSDVQVQVPIINNGLPEGNKTVTMVLTNVSNSVFTAPTNATLTIIDNVSAPGQLFFNATNYTVNQGDGTAYLTVLRSNGFSGSVSVTYNTAAGTAQPGVNYTTTSGQVTFGNGEISKQIPVPLVNNNLVEGITFFSVLLSNPTGGATLTTPSTATVSIINNNTGFAFINATNYVRETNGLVPIFVQRIGGTNAGETVEFTTTNTGTAQAGVNYTPVNGTLTFAENEMIKAISLPLFYNPQVTGNLTLGMVLFNPGAGTYLTYPSNALVVIQDANAGVSFTTNAMSVNKNSGVAVVTVVCGNPSVEPVIVNSNTIPLSVEFATADDSAQAGVDYVATNGVLVFTNGIGTNTFNVTILNNSLVTGNHAFTVNLFNPTPTNVALVVAPSNLVVTIVDNNSGFSYSSPVYTVLKTGVSAAITVNRTDNTNQTSSVNFSTADGTAQAGVDYFPTNGLMVFTNGDVSKSFNVTVIANTVVQPDKTVLLQLFNPTNAFLIAPYSATLTIHDDTGSLVVPAGSQLVHESLITNGIIDPGETVTMLLALRASGGTNIPDVLATLLVTNGVTAPIPSTPVDYGPMAVGGPAVSRLFTFTAVGTNGQQIAATLLINNGVTDIGTAEFTYTLGMWTNTFVNTNGIIINGNALATPYPSAITVTNIGGTLVNSFVTLSNLYQVYPAAVNALVVSPAGQDTLIMSHAGGPTNVAKITLTFDDGAPSYLSGTNTLTTSTNRPTRYFSTPIFP